MNGMDRLVISRIKESLTRMAEAVESEPVVFIDVKGKHWFSDAASEFILENGVVRNNFVDWLKIGSSHLQHFSYGEVDIHLIRLIEGGVIAFLSRSKNKSGFRKCMLTEKENEVLLHLAKGKTNKQIADILKISPGTVNSHLDSIYQKLGCSNRLTACLLALQNGYLLPKHNKQPR